MFKGVCAAIGAVFVATTASAAPVQWSGNGHWYEFIGSSGVTTAEEFASTLSWQGETGYVATITSQAEQDFLNALWPGDSAYLISGKDTRDEGTFRYDGGPEDGEELVYTNWAPFEPNDFDGGEDFIEAWFQGSPLGLWNDVPGNRGPFVVEYNGTIGGEVPLPASLPLMLAGLIGLGALRRRK